MCEDSQGRPANMLLFQIQMGVLTSNFKIIIKITRPPVQSSPVHQSSECILPTFQVFTVFYTNFLLVLIDIRGIIFILL